MRTAEGVWFAIARMEIPDCSRIWARVMLAVSCAKFVSKISLWACDTFSKALLSVEMLVLMTFDCKAPILPLRVET